MSPKTKSYTHDDDKKIKRETRKLRLGTEQVIERKKVGGGGAESTGWRGVESICFGLE